MTEWLIREDTMCTVENVTKDSFGARVDGGGYAAFLISDVSPIEVDLVQNGARFRWSTGRMLSKWGQVASVSQVTFARLLEQEKQPPAAFTSEKE